MEEIKFIPRDQFETAIWNKRSWSLKKKLEVIFDHRERTHKMRIMLAAVNKSISTAGRMLAIEARDVEAKVDQIIVDAEDEIDDTFNAIMNICQKGGDNYVDRRKREANKRQ